MKPVKRSLLLAGGGIKVGYQAGCLQVLLDEVPAGKLTFDHIDAASGGCFNAAMICSGKSGTQIASAWREMNPFDMVSLNFREWHPWGQSIATLDAIRTKAFVDWGLDFSRIRQFDAYPVTFNYYDFARKEIKPLINSKLDPDYLCACVSLMMWFPPVYKEGRPLVDSVFATDADISEAERRGATEIWAIWSVANQPQIRNGFIAQYFHILEQAADAKFDATWKRAEQGGITLHLVRQEVPINYLFNFSQDRMAATVDLGIDDMRRYCHEQGLIEHIHAVPPPPTAPVAARVTSVEFAETLTGSFFRRTAAGFSKVDLTLRLKLETGDLTNFIRSPFHESHVSYGKLHARGSFGKRDITEGSVALLVDERASGIILPGNKRMRYLLRFRAQDGTPFRFEGTKFIVDGSGKNVWRDTTTLYFRLVELRDTDPAFTRVYGAGIVRLTPSAFILQLLSFRASGTANPLAAFAAVWRFWKFCIRQCWDVYVRNVLDYAPF